MIGFRDAVDAKDVEAMAASLSPQVRFSSPVVFRPYEGRDAVMGVLKHVVEVLEDFEYIDELAGDGTFGLVFRARVGEKSIEGWDYLLMNDEGLVEELTVMIRPLSGLIAVAEAMGARIAADQQS